MTLVSQEAVKRYGMSVGGERVDALEGQEFGTIDPYAGIAWATAPEAVPDDVDRAVRSRAMLGT